VDEWHVEEAQHLTQSVEAKNALGGAKNAARMGRERNYEFFAYCENGEGGITN